jgi:hypothetical protein
MTLLAGMATATGCREDAHPVVDAGVDGGRDADRDSQDDRPPNRTDGAADQVVDRGADGDGAPDTDAGDAGDTGNAPPDTGPLLTEQSFTVSATFLFTPRGVGFHQPVAPVTQEMTLRIDPNGRTLVVGQADAVAMVNLRPGTNRSFDTTSSFMLPLNGNGACSTRVTVESLNLGVDPSALSALGAGRAEVLFGDVAASYDIGVSMVGLRDAIGPALGGDQTGVDPLDALHLPLSEPLAATATARLTTTGAQVDLLTRKSSHATSFDKPAAVALRYATTYQVEVEPWRDLAQIPGRMLPTITSQAAPPLIPEDGFESAPPNLGGGTVAQAPAFPVLAGQKSVLIAPRNSFFGSERFTVRLARQANDAVVRLTVRPISRYEATVSTFSVSMRVAVPGGAIVQATLPPNETVATRFEPPAPGQALFMGPSRTVEIALPPMTGPEIVFDLATQFPQGCGLFPPAAGYLIDDLRVE